MGISNQLQAISNGFQIVASYPGVAQHADRDRRVGSGRVRRLLGAHQSGERVSQRDDVLELHRGADRAHFELADLHKVNLLGSVTWAFEFEDQPYFAGFRDLATNGIDKPVLNVFRMLGKMHGDRVAVTSTERRGRGIDSGRQGSRPQPMSTRWRHAIGRAVEVLVWNYHDDDLPAPPAAIAMTIDGLPAGTPTIMQYRVDDRHSNAYEVWKGMGSPQSPTAAQRVTLEKAGQLQNVGSATRQRVDEGRLTFNLSLPRQGVALFTIMY